MASPILDCNVDREPGATDNLIPQGGSDSSPAEVSGQAEDAVAFTNTNTALTLTSRPVGCKHPFLAPSNGGPRWRRCGRGTCSRGCSDLWRWKQSLSLIRSFEILPPSHFATILPRSGMTNAVFGLAATRFVAALVRRVRGLAYLTVREWRNGVEHRHGLLRGPVTRRAVRESRRFAGVRASVRPVRNVIGVANYVLKVTNQPDKKAELPPAGFRGRLFTASRGFLVKPMRALWKTVRAERAARRGVVK